MNFKFIKLITTPLLFISFLSGDVLDRKIGSMLMLGFVGTKVHADSQICKDISTYDLGGVILFDYNPVDKDMPKNIVSKEQSATIAKELQACSPKHNLLISADQEGGKVQRLKSNRGFYGKFPSAASVADMDDEQTRKIYSSMAKELKNAGFNYDLAPVVDLALNKDNYIIYELGRSYGKDPVKVSHKADLFIDEMHKEGVLTSIKHFPGHGSSLGDTHKGYVDVTNTWSKVELEPYKLLSNKADSVMVAHVFNSKLDANHPASLSHATVTKLLRGDLGYDGVVITDDLQMGAITKKYTLRETLKLAIKAGDDILLFGNQLHPKNAVNAKMLVDIIKDLLAKKEISIEEINKAHERVQKLRAKLKGSNV
ncbi:MAG: glycoside hydrolase family 3 protein [Sulfurovaceae bacterium]